MDRLYIFDCPGSKCFKVGVSNDIHRRVAEIRAQGFEIDNETSFYSDSQDKKFVLEVEKVVKFLLRDSQTTLGVSKESGFSEWYSASRDMSTTALAGILNMFFGARLNLQRDLQKLADTIPQDFYLVCDRVDSLVADKERAKAKYVEALMASFEMLPEYLLEFMEVSHGAMAQYLWDISRSGDLWFFIQNPAVGVEVSQGHTLHACLDSAMELVQYHNNTDMANTSFYTSDTSSEYGIIKTFNLSINITALGMYLSEIQSKTGPRPLAVVKKLTGMLKFICRDSLPHPDTKVIDGEEE